MTTNTKCKSKRHDIGISEEEECAYMTKPELSYWIAVAKLVTRRPCKTFISAPK